MKKVFGFILIAASLALTACGNDVNETDENLVIEKTINVYTRDSASGTREAFSKVIGIGDGELTNLASEVSSNGDMASKVGNDENGIGYVSITTDFESNGVKPLKYEGIEATVENINDGSYTLQRSFNYVLRESYSDEKVQELCEAFIAYITKSEEGIAVIESACGIVDYTNAVSWDKLKVNYPILEEDNSNLTIRTGGSTSVEKCISAALQSFSPIAGNVKYAMDQTGSSDGWKRTIGDEANGVNEKEIGFASRDFKTSEDVSNSLESGSFCKDGVVVIVNEENDLISNITMEDLYSIYTGEVTVFNDVQ